MSDAARDVRVLAAVVNYEGADMSLAAVASVLGQEGAGAVRVVVIDNGSSTADREKLEAGLGGRVELLHFDINRGYGAACNAAARLAAESGIAYVWWLNNDVLLEPGALVALLAQLEASPATAAAGAVAVDHETGRRVLGAGMSLTLWRGRVRHLYPGIDVAHLPQAPYQVDVIPATCMLVRLAALREIGGMDEGYFMYTEDVDWSVRAVAAGFRLDIVPQARVRHGWARSSRPEDRLRYMMRNRVRLIRARAGLVGQALFMTYFAIGWLPAYTIGRLIPRYGLRAGLRLAVSPLTWNLRDAIRRGRWRLRPEDVEIGRI